MEASESDQIIWTGGLGDRQTKCAQTAAVEDPAAKRVQEETDDQRELRIRAEMAHVVQPDHTTMFLLARLDRLRAYGPR